VVFDHDVGVVTLPECSALVERIFVSCSHVHSMAMSLRSGACFCRHLARQLQAAVQNQIFNFVFWHVRLIRLPAVRVGMIGF